MNLFFIILSVLIFNVFANEEVYTSDVPFKSFLYSVVDGQLFIGTSEVNNSNNLISLGRDGRVNILNYPKDHILSKNVLSHFCYLGSRFFAVGMDAPNEIHVKTYQGMHIINNLNGSDNKPIKSIIGMISDIPSQVVPASVTDVEEYTNIFCAVINESNEIDIIVINIPNLDEFQFSQSTVISTGVEADNNCAVKLYWDQYLHILYGCFKNDLGDQKLIRFFYDNGNFYLNTFDLDDITKKINITKISSMLTTTHLNYLLISSDNAVYSLPLVNFFEMKKVEGKNKSNYGYVADMSKNPENIFVDRGFFYNRLFREPHNLMKHIDFNSNNIKVGNGLLPGKITHMQINADTVIVSSKGLEEDGGIFYSKAIFSETGVIKGWTNWQKACGAKSTEVFAYDAIYNAFTYVPVDEDGTIKKIVKNVWNIKQAKDIEKEVSKSFDKNGIYFGRDCGDFLAFSGKNKLILIKSDSLNKLVFDRVHPINSISTISFDGRSWLVVSDSRGLEVLSDENGSGWISSNGVGNDFENIKHMTLKKIADYKNIKKLRSENNKLYVLTDHELSCLSFHDILIKPGFYKGSTIIRDKDLKFNDAIITDKSIVLATNKGLYHLSKGNLKKIDLPESVGRRSPVIKLEEVGISGNDDSSVLNGNFYVLNAHIDSEQAQLYRFCFDKNGNPELLPDYFVRNKKTFFINFGNYRENFMTNGLSNFTRGVNIDSGSTYMEIIAPFIRSGQKASAHKSQFLGFNKGFKKFRGIFQEKSSGSVMAYGDFGLLVN